MKITLLRVVVYLKIIPLVIFILYSPTTAAYLNCKNSKNIQAQKINKKNTLDSFLSKKRKKDALKLSLKFPKQVSVITSKTTGLKPEVLNLALKAYKQAEHKNKLKVKKSILTVVDYSIPSVKPRFWVIDLKKNRILHHLHVTHGRGSGVGKYPKKFSNRPRSFASSLGVFITGKVYKGRHGKSLNLHGLEKNYNSNAYRRRVVVHGARYASKRFAKKYGFLGHSHGCFALDTSKVNKIINLIKDGSVIFAYHPDSKWLKQSKYFS
jgi:hypothetical protein